MPPQQDFGQLNGSNSQWFSTLRWACPCRNPLSTGVRIRWRMRTLGLCWRTS